MVTIEKAVLGQWSPRGLDSLSQVFTALRAEFDELSSGIDADLTTDVTDFHAKFPNFVADLADARAKYAKFNADLVTLRTAATALVNKHNSLDLGTGGGTHQATALAATAGSGTLAATAGSQTLAADGAVAIVANPTWSVEA